MPYRLPAIFLLLLGSLHLVAQRITHGPIIGAVSDTGATVYVRTSQACTVQLQIIGNGSSQQLEATISTAYDTSCMLRINGLQPNSHYTVRATIDNGKSPVEAQFSTFPSANDKENVVFTFGSCIEQVRTDSIFLEMSKHKPLFFLHLGDWTYPDHEDYPNDKPGGTNHYYSSDYQKVEQAYRVRYSMPFMNAFLSKTPIDFIHDDDDFAFDGNGLNTHSGQKFDKGNTVLLDLPLPPNARSNAIKGYMEHFPHYNIEHPTQDGLYHRFQCGNVEIFFLDSRANRDGENNAFKIKNGHLHFAPSPNHTMLGEAQMDWLLKGLAASTADWKFIVSGTNFNRSYRRALDMALLLQNQEVRPGMTGGMIGAQMAAMWLGYPYDQAKLINFIADQQIKNVIVLSGDAHCSAIDNGKNSGIAEVMSGNLGVPNTMLTSIVHNELGLTAWNGGGQGIGNNNFNNCFGKMEVFGTDSVKASIIDMYGQVVTQYKFQNGIKVEKVRARNLTGDTFYTRMRLVKDFLRFIKVQLTKSTN